MSASAHRFQSSTPLSQVFGSRDAGAPRLACGLDAAAFEAIAKGEPAGTESGAGITYRDLFRPISPRLEVWAHAHGVELRGLRPLRRERGGHSVKHLFGLRDGYAVETVRIRRFDGATACVSSQVGCAVGCTFCASGRGGIKRNLEAGEIVEQVVRLGSGINRIVFMGIGEPLHNYDNVLRAIRILRDRRGIGFPASGITVSTIGPPDALRKLREEHLALNLTVSLHATTQEIRDRIVPGARRHRLEYVVEGGLSWAGRHGRIVTFAYLLLPGINDAQADAVRLARMLQGQPARVNLMRWNPVDDVGLSRIGDATLARFRAQLAEHGIPVVVRDTQGRDINAACGQLWLRTASGELVRRRGGTV